MKLLFIALQTTPFTPHGIHSDFTKILVQIDIKIPKSQVNPSEQIDICITSNPNSFIGLLGVDQSVLVLKKGNNIEESAVIDDLKHYNEVSRKYDKRIPIYQYKEKKYLDFESSEVFIITNAKRAFG